MKKMQIIALALVLLAGGIAGSLWVTYGVERRMRNDLLQRANLVASSLSNGYICTLNGDTADIEAQAYQRLKQQLVDIRQKNPDISWIYLIKQKDRRQAGGGAEDIVFLATSEAPGESLDPSLPGRPYADAPAIMQRMFHNPGKLVIGPYDDQWGCWITAIIPIFNPKTGSVAALLCLDIEGGRWRLDAVTRSVIPLVLILLIVVGIGGWVMAERIAFNPEHRSLFYRLLYPLFSVMAIVVICFCFLLIYYQKERRNQLTETALDNASKSILVALDEKTQTLTVLQKLILQHQPVIDAIKQQSAKALDTAMSHVSQQIEQIYPIDCLSIYNADGQILFSSPAPNGEADFARQTLTLSMKNKTATSGIEVTANGDVLQLRVMPIYENDATIGFISIGQKLWTLIDQIANKRDEPMFVAINKSLITDSSRDEATLSWGHKGDKRLVYHTGKALSASQLKQIQKTVQASPAKHHIINTEHQSGRLMSSPIMDIGGHEIGTIHVLVDTDEMLRAQRRHALLLVCGSLSMGMLLFALLYTLVRRAERSISAQQRSLREKRAEALVLAKKADIANEAKTHFLTNIGHELRTPMNGIIGFADILAETMLDKTQQYYLSHVRGCSNDLLASIDNLLHFTHLESGDFKLHTTGFALTELLSPIHFHFKPEAGKKKLSFYWYVYPDVPTHLVGDKSCISNILRNLLHNALKFTDSGEVSFSLCIQKSAATGKKQLAFMIRDTGIGIPEEKLSVIFDRFSQVESALTRAYGGMGIGLAMSRRMAEAMNGEIQVKSTLGQGSTFTLIIPLITDEFSS